MIYIRLALSLICVKRLVKTQAERFDEPLNGVYNVYNLQHNLRRHEDKPQASIWKYIELLPC